MVSLDKIEYTSTSKVERLQTKDNGDIAAENFCVVPTSIFYLNKHIIFTIVAEFCGF